MRVSRAYWHIVGELFYFWLWTGGIQGSFEQTKRLACFGEEEHDRSYPGVNRYLKGSNMPTCWA